MAKILTIVDDINGAHNAKERWAAICNGEKVFLFKIDLVDRNHSTMEKAFKDAMSRWSVNGEVSIVKVADLASFLLSEDVKPAEVVHIDPVITEPEPEPEPEPAPVAAPAAPKARRRRVPAGEVPPREQRPVAANGEPFSPYLMKVLKRPGITQWWQRNADLLQLSPPRKGRIPKDVDEAWDRYQGQDVTLENMLPEDMERLDSATAPGASSGRMPTPKDLFSHGG